MSVLCVLPARLESRRIPRKPLVPVAGRPLVEWSWRAARRVSDFDRVCVATDSEEIAEVVRGFGGEAVLTDRDHRSGTDRVAEVAARAGARSHEIVVNYQADEPFLPPALVGRTVTALRSGGADIATIAVPVTSGEEWRTASVVKVVTDGEGRALYFSRAPVPHRRDGEPDWSAAPVEPEDADTARRGSADGSNGCGPDPVGADRWPYLRHVGLYAFTRAALERWAGLEPSTLEAVERLEQLRALEAGMTIRVAVGPPVEPGVDEPADLERAETLLAREDGADA